MKNNSFLEKLANHILSTSLNNTTNTIVILPNKRAKIFLLEELKQQAEQTFFAPVIISIEDFIADLSGIRVLDPIELLFAFYEVYLSITPKESVQDFEHFSNWAKIILQDFNEIDRYLISPSYVFSYLKEIEALKRWDLSADKKTDWIKKQLQFWDLLPQYYQSFYNHLLQKKVGYQGLIYREAVNNLPQFITNYQNKNIIFAGFNALNKAEENIIQSLLSSNTATVLWDIDTVFLNNKSHDAALFVRRFKNKWQYYKNNPMEWIVSEFSETKNIQIIGTSKSVGQAKIVASILQDDIITKTNGNLNKVALVLGDENLLLPILHSLPQNVGALNITMGYSSKNNPIQILIAKLFKMHTNALKRNPNHYVFYYKDVIDVLSNPLIETYIDAKQCINLIKKNNYTFITHQKIVALAGHTNTFFELLFQKWDGLPLDILERISAVLQLIKNNIAQSSEGDNQLTQTFLYSIYTVINKLISYCSTNNYVNSIDLLYAMYKQIIDLAEVSFEGEPLTGLQIMGVLESRVLDFDTVIITSMNEGKFPAGKTVNTFIPYDVKKEIGLPTFKEKDAIYTYHFYHLLLRAKNIYLLYNTESDGLDGGEKSRFITQLEVEKMPNHNITHHLIQPKVPNIAYQKISITKSAQIINRLQEIGTNKGFSPSALTTYIRNPIQFYFQRILSIREAEEVEENIALNTLGTIIHKTLEILYTPYIGAFLSTANLDYMITQLDTVVYEQFREIYKEGEIKKGKNLLAFAVAKQNVLSFLQDERRLLQAEDVVKIIALEATLSRVLETDNMPRSVILSGNVDRIEIRNNVIRIIDYKTGKVEPRSLQITSWEDLTTDIKNEKIIQLLCYAFMYQEQLKDLPMEVGIISFKNKKAGFMPFGFKEQKNVSTIISTEIITSFKQQIALLLNEILNPEIPFEEKN